MSQPTSLESQSIKLPGSNACAMSLALLLLRLVLGFTFIFHGAQKPFGAFGGPGIEAFSQFLGTMPAFLPKITWAYMAALSEFVGGISVLLEPAWARLGVRFPLSLLRCS